MQTNLFLADDHFVFYGALSVWLEMAPDYAIVGAVTRASALLAQVAATHPDILLLDWELADLPTAKAKAQLIHTLRAQFPHLRIIALSSKSGVRQQALASGVHAFVNKAESPEHLLDALRQNRRHP